ncbi:ComEC/Rec2 family competence protein [Methylobacterium dankookense]|uniref:ComE operon protein 3 n=1 Tax=Methylobacterium dankookense TaxID=560405 RepID=A0A564FWJ5_9HYPH|nr:ComEC/Rec2 family competence protein [Methylobacterium dankookense]GJD54403.1 hypothetical protein IFDJLNFL_0274 [Methylobacterium dankookense]VUF12138.1 ComE operon protein 3 [Methylobacterium dankookense]
MERIGAGRTGGSLALAAASRPLRLAAPALRDWFGACLAQEAAQRRLFPWLAVAFGMGILAFFGLAEGAPALWAPLGAAALCIAPLPWLGARPVALALLLALAAGWLGFASAAWRVSQVAAPVLARTTIAPLAGIIESIEEREEGARLVVLVSRFGTLAPEAMPRRVRVSFRKAPPLRPGDGIEATARLLPPPEAARPGGYDFARDAWFRGIGAVGSLTGRIAVKPPAEQPPPAVRLAAEIDAARNALTRRIADATGGQAGAVAAALVTGKRGLIAPATNETLRAAGIYHVVSISGLHMVLAAGVVFWLVRAALALIPHLALFWPIKKIAAGAAMAGVGAYCIFSGWDVAAQRALVMTLIMLGAILVDRPALSMRNLALAAFAALAREPEALLGPSFQMSFGAVAGLIACARLLDGNLLRREGAGRLGRAIAFALSAVVGTLGTTLVAQIATAPFATFHFQTVQPFGIVGNALTLPLVSLVVMPSAVLGILAYPFALDVPIWWLMGQAVAGMLAISAWIEGFGGATVVVPAFPPAALACLAVALLLATLPGSGLRRLALAPALGGLAFAAAPERPDIFVDRHGSGAAMRGADGRLFALGKPSAFVMEQWLKADGDARKPGEASGSAVCDPVGCVGRLADGRAVAFVRDRRAFAEDCARAAVVVSGLTAPPNCAALVIDRAYLGRHGATALRATPQGFAISHARRPGRPEPPGRTAELRPAASTEPPASTGPPDPQDEPSPGEPGDEAPQ